MLIDQVRVPRSKIFLIIVYLWIGRDPEINNAAGLRTGRGPKQPKATKRSRRGGALTNTGPDAGGPGRGCRGLGGGSAPPHGGGVRRGGRSPRGGGLEPEGWC